MPEWTKMRNTLPSNPKVVGMAQFLGSQRKLLAPLTTGYGGALLEVVTLDVVVSVVVCGLLRVWGTANEVARDGVLKGVTLEGLDAIAHVPGFGRAMAEVGWARESKRPIGVVLPNFSEFNVPVDQRAADRQKRYRERIRGKQAGDNSPEDASPSGLDGVTDAVTGDVTRDVTRNDRPDQTRPEPEEIKKQPPPTVNDARALAGYAGECCFVRVEAVEVGKLLKVFGTGVVVEVFEHLASRDPAHWESVKSPVGLVRSMCKLVADGEHLEPQGGFQPFAEWREAAEKRVAAVCGNGGAGMTGGRG